MKTVKAAVRSMPRKGTGSCRMRLSMMMALLMIVLLLLLLVVVPSVVGFVVVPVMDNNNNRRYDSYWNQQRLYATTTDASSGSSSTDSNSKKQSIITTTTTTTTTSGSDAVRSQRPTPILNHDEITHFQMISFYRFFPRSSSSADSLRNNNVKNIKQLRDDIFDSLIDRIPGIRGTLYIAQEGFNGQFAIPISLDLVDDSCTSMDDFIKIIDDILFDDSSDDESDSVDVKTAKDIMNFGDIVPIDTPTFQKLIVRTRDSILRDGLSDHQGDIDGMDLDWDNAGEEVSPEVWDEELRRGHGQQGESSSAYPMILDCRNDYESNQGRFQKAIPLNTTTFSESWDILDQLQQFEFDDSSSNSNDDNDNAINKNDPIYIYCTGGIRCVKVGAYMKQKLGFTNVKRLQHGIIGYQKWWQENQLNNNKDNKEEEDEEEEATSAAGVAAKEGSSSFSSLWQGENFLFDKRRFAATETSTTATSKMEGKE